MNLIKCPLSEATHLRSATGHVWGPGQWRLDSTVYVPRDHVCITIHREELEEVNTFGIEPCKVKELMREVAEHVYRTPDGQYPSSITVTLGSSWKAVNKVRVTIEEIPKKESE